MNWKNKIVIIRCDDWILIYVNGEIYTEGHEIDRLGWFKLGHRFGNYEVKRIYIHSQLQEDLDLYTFPNNINELPEQILMHIERSDEYDL